MSECRQLPVSVLVAVDDASFACEIIEILRTLAPFPIDAAITNSLEHALQYIGTSIPDVLLLDSMFRMTPQAVPLLSVREISRVPTIVFTSAISHEIEQKLKAFGAEAVLSRYAVDPTKLLETMTAVLESTGKLKSNVQSILGGSCNSSKTDFSNASADHMSSRRVGADLLLQVLNDQLVLPAPQKEKLRQLLFRSRPKES